MKACSHCGEVKPLDSFYPSRARSPNGRQSRCKACNAEVLRSYRAARKERAMRRAEAIRTRVVSATALVQR